MISEAYSRMLGRSQGYLDLIDRLLPVAQRHSYKFYDELTYKEWINSDEFSIAVNNQIWASELIDKAHLAAVTSLIWTRRWADAICQAYLAPNYFAWAAAFRGLLESSGDIYDGLGHVGLSLAKNHAGIRAVLLGRSRTIPLFSEIEEKLDHYVLATWGRSKNTRQVLVARSNVEYVKHLEHLIPGVESLYHQLCAIVHPSIASIEWTYNRAGKFQIKADDLSAIDAVTRKFPEAIPSAFMQDCPIDSSSSA